MDASPAQKADTGAAQPILRAIASTADVFMLASPVSFIRPSNIISLDAWRRKRRTSR